MNAGAALCRHHAIEVVVLEQFRTKRRHIGREVIYECRSWPAHWKIALLGVIENHGSKSPINAVVRKELLIHKVVGIYDSSTSCASRLDGFNMARCEADHDLVCL